MTGSRLDELEEENRAHAPARVRSLLAAWARGWLRAPRPAAFAPLPEAAPGAVAITFAGHATILVRYAGLTIACDPVLSRRLGLAPRLEEPGLTPADLTDVGLVLLSHAHPGHLDARTLEQLPREATIVVPPRCAARVSGLGFARVVELAAGHGVAHRGVDVTATPVRHDPRGGGAAAYVIRGDGPSVFFCGDSAYFPGFAAVGRRYRPDVAVLPIGGYLPASFRDRHMSPPDALLAFEDLGARMLVPIHFGAFPLSYEEPGDPRRWLLRLVEERDLGAWVTVLEPGASICLTTPRPAAAP